MWPTLILHLKTYLRRERHYFILLAVYDILNWTAVQYPVLVPVCFTFHQTPVLYKRKEYEISSSTTSIFFFPGVISVELSLVLYQHGCIDRRRRFSSKSFLQNMYSCVCLLSLIAMRGKLVGRPVLSLLLLSHIITPSALERPL